MIREGIKSDLTLYTSVNLINIDDKDIIEINVMDAPNKPYYLTDKDIKTSGVYLRYGNTSAPASEEVIKKNNKINRNIVEKLLDISSTRAKNILNNMCENKLIVMVGSGKNIIYVLKCLESYEIFNAN